MNCFKCGFVAPPVEWAKHIQETGHGNFKSKQIAANIMLRTKALDKKATIQQQNSGRMPLSEKAKEAKKNLQVELSGQMVSATTKCPTCRNTTWQNLPLEYVSSPFTWKTQTGALITNCQTCRR